MINGSRVEIVLWPMVSLKNTSCQQHTSDLRHWCRYTNTHRREPAMYYTHRLWLFTRSFSHHLMINMPLSNACSSATQCLQSQLVQFFLFLFFLSSLIYPFFPDLSLFASSHPSLMTLSGRIMNPLPFFCPLHSSSMAAAHLHFLCCCLRKGKELILRKAIQVLRFFICAQVIEWVWNPAELTSRHSYICVFFTPLSHLVFTL